MDPVSVTASVIAILGTGGVIAKGLGKIRRLKNAPTILLQLNNEVADLHLLVQAVDELCRHSTLSPPLQRDLVYNNLERTRNALLELEQLIEYTLSKETNSGSQINRMGWIGSLHRIKEVKDTLRAARDDLITVWAVLGNK